MMIEKFETMLGQNLSEAHWQQFFEANLFILGMVFARPVAFLHTQFHASLSSRVQIGRCSLSHLNNRSLTLRFLY